MCGIVGIIHGNQANNNIIHDLIETLFQLQHRGQDGYGIITGSGRESERHCLKGTGLTSNIFTSQTCPDVVTGSLGIGHVRYRTSGGRNAEQAQPLSSLGRHVIDLAHNGHISYPPPTHPSGLDSYAILETLARSLDTPAGAIISVASVIRALREVYMQCRGSFACTVLLNGHMLVGFRDSYGIKPLVLGKRHSDMASPDWMLASESAAFKQLDFSYVCDVYPGEAVIMDKNLLGTGMTRHRVVPDASYYPDIFEYVYFARADSVMDGISVHRCRQRMGLALAQACLRKLEKNADEIDIVVPVPETAYVTGVELANALGKPLSLSLVKNRYSSRSFILPSQGQRTKAVRRKITTVDDEMRGKSVLIVDDSIVRGNTSREIVALARRAGAVKVIFASASPAIRYNHIHGIDLADPQALVAHGRGEEDVARAIGADAVVYLPLYDLIECCLKERRNMDVKRFEVGMFTGEYVDRANGFSAQPINEWTVAATSLGDNASAALPKGANTIVEVRS